MAGRTPSAVSMTTFGSACRFRYQAGCVLMPPFEATTTRLSPSGTYTSGTVRARPVLRPVVVTRQIGAPLGAFPLTRPFDSRNTTLLRPVIHCTVKRPNRSWNGDIGLDRSGGTAFRIGVRRRPRCRPGKRWRISPGRLDLFLLEQRDWNGDGMTTDPETPAKKADDSGHGPEPDDRWFSDMTKFWLQARQDLEGYALKYLSPSTPPNPMLAQDWMNDGASLVVDLWSLWTRGVTLTAVESGRLVAEALRGKDQQSSRSESRTGLLDAMERMVRQVLGGGGGGADAASAKDD